MRKTFLTRRRSRSRFNVLIGEWKIGGRTFIGLIYWRVKRLNLHVYLILDSRNYLSCRVYKHTDHRNIPNPAGNRDIAV